VRVKENDESIRVLFLGMSNPTSAAVLDGLLQAGLQVCAVLIAADRRDGPPIVRIAPPPAPGLIPLVSPFLERTAAQIAWDRGLPVFELRRPAAAEALATLAELRPDVACVACFPLRIPAPLLALPPLGFLNMHPALLPLHRGPAPLFWTFRAGERAAGVTIHFMDAGLDTGAIVAQEAFDLPDGISGAAVERRCDALGARLMAAALRELSEGTLARRAQPPGGSYEGWPAPEDWRLDSGWAARRAFNFMRGTADWGQPYLVRAGGQELVLRSAIAYHPEGLPAETPLVRVGDEVLIQLADGVLQAREI
jgi:methionyl-tRNA formyltransferase